MCVKTGRKSDVRNVWARVGNVEDHSAVDPTLLDSLAEDLVVPPHTNVGDIGRRGSDAVDDCSSVSSESCWGEMEDIGKFLSGVCCPILHPARRKSALEEDVDVPHRSESGSLFVGGADVVHIHSKGAVLQ